jgi:hypothetical protein
LNEKKNKVLLGLRASLEDAQNAQNEYGLLLNLDSNVIKTNVLIHPSNLGDTISPVELEQAQASYGMEILGAFCSPFPSFILHPLPLQKKNRSL